MKNIFLATLLAAGCQAGTLPAAHSPVAEQSAIKRMLIDFDYDGDADGWCTVFHLGDGVWGTARHCLVDEGDRFITDGGARYQVYATRYSETEDVSTFKTDYTATNRLAVAGDLPKFGERVHYVGYPGTGDFKPHLVAAEGLYSGVENGDILFISMVDGGASGSPLMNAIGEVVGIVVASYRGTQYAYAEPVANLTLLINQAE